VSYFLFCKIWQPNGPARRGKAILPQNAVIGPLVAGYDSAKFGSPMGPRAAERLSCLRMQ